MKYGIHRFALVIALAGLAAVLACGHTPNSQGPVPKDLSSRQAKAPGEYLITLAPGADARVVAALYGRFGIKEMKDRGHNVFRVILAEDPGPARMEELRKQSAYIRSVQPD